ncbi:MAG: COX15/CtaA family protein [Myxococcota bacterium]
MLGNAVPSRDEIDAEQRRYALRLAGGFGALLAATYGLLVLGALVRANHAGLACPDWPLCFGEFVPEMDLRVGFEWTHRVVAGSIAVAFAGLAAAALRRPRSRRVTRTPLAVGALLLGLQILLGALTVWELLAAWTVTSHLLVGNAFAVAVLWSACALRDQAMARAAAPPVARAARRAVEWAAALLVLQLVLGGLVSSRYAGLACPEWPACRDGVWFPSWSGNAGLHQLHRLTGYALLGALAAAAIACRRDPVLRRLSGLALALGVVQVGVGISNVLLRIPVELTGLHSALAAALVLTLAVEVREVARRRQRRRAGATRGRCARTRSSPP